MLFLVVFEIDAFTNGYVGCSKKRWKIRYIIEITRYKIKYCNKLYKLVDELGS
jgi:hypothetical protein